MSSVTQTPGTNLRLRYRDAAGIDRDVNFPIDVVPFNERQGRRANSGATSKVITRRLLLHDDFEKPDTNFHNDGVGLAFRDTEVVFDNGNASYRLELPGNLTTVTGQGSTPGNLPNSNGVISKRRITPGPNFLNSGKFELEYWFRFTSTNIGGNNFVTTTIYSRDGTNSDFYRFWADEINDALKINNTGTWDTVEAFDLYTDHTFEPDTGNFDQAGSWQYVRLAVDMINKKYIELQYNDKVYDISTKLPATVAQAGLAKHLHFSFEFGYSTDSSFRRYYNIAGVRVYEVTA